MLDAKEAMKVAQQNYETWGHYIVETRTLDELQEDLQGFNNLEEWIYARERVAEIHQEIEAQTKP